MDGRMNGVNKLNAMGVHKRTLSQQWGFQKHNISDGGLQLISILLSSRKFKERYLVDKKAGRELGEIRAKMS